jgi:hypothetical protein
MQLFDIHMYNGWRGASSGELVDAHSPCFMHDATFPAWVITQADEFQFM